MTRARRPIDLKWRSCACAMTTTLSAPAADAVDQVIEPHGHVLRGQPMEEAGPFPGPALPARPPGEGGWPVAVGLDDVWLPRSEERRELDQGPTVESARVLQDGEGMPRSWRNAAYSVGPSDARWNRTG